MDVLIETLGEVKGTQEENEYAAFLVSIRKWKIL